MAFPSSPTIGDLHQTSSGITYEYIAGNTWQKRTDAISCDNVTAPSAPSVTTGVDPNNLSSLPTPSPGDVIVLDGNTTSLTFNRSLNGWVGTVDRPIVLIGNGSTLTNRALEIIDCAWIEFYNFTMDNNPVGSSIIIEHSTDLIFNNVDTNQSNGNGYFVVGNANGGSARIKWFNCSTDNFGTDGISIHASNATDVNGNKYENGSHFLIKDCTGTNAINSGAENFIDFTSGQNLYVINCTGTNANFHAAHGVRNIYVNGYTDVREAGHTESGGRSMEFRNTDGEIWVANCLCDGELDLGVTGSPRALELPNSKLSTPGSPLYITYEIQTFNNTFTGGIDNNTSGSGSIITALGADPFLSFTYPGFNCSK